MASESIQTVLSPADTRFLSGNIFGSNIDKTFTANLILEGISISCLLTLT